MGDETTPHGGNTSSQTLKAGAKGFLRAPARVVADSLLGKSIIGSSRMRGPLTVRYTTLYSRDIFRSLVDLYSTPFQSYWEALSHMVSPHSIGQVNPVTYLARVYISHWFIDLYVSIRDACIRHEGVDVTDYYEKVQSVQSNYYDCFLVSLLQSIKPTHIQGTLEDALYIPKICDVYQWDAADKNVFDITGFTRNSELFKALINLMRNPSTGWHTATPSNDPTGKPCWLFDWHREKAYAWFPEDDNFNYDDRNLAYIIGVPCTPLLASRDKDFPQQYPHNRVIDNMNLKTLHRRIPKRFRSNIDVRTIENLDYSVTRPLVITTTRETPASRPLAIGGGSGETEAQVIRTLAAPQRAPSQSSETSTETLNVKYTVHMFRIVDYMYYQCVLRKVEINTRAAAHKVLTYRE
nr:capsid protein [Helianthus annus leaf-associated cryptic virus 1]